MNEPASIQALLFDMGGVVIEIDFERAFRHWEGFSRLTLAEIRERFAMDAAYQQHERGEIDGSAYFAHLRQLLVLEGTDHDIALGWNAIYLGTIGPTLHAVRRARSRLPCFAFTNSNPTHQSAWMAAYPEVVAAFDRIFVSSEMGLRKPERAAFEAVAASSGVALAAMLFFDDTYENVDGARAAGLRAVHVRSPADVEQALVGIDML